MLLTAFKTGGNLERLSQCDLDLCLMWFPLFMQQVVLTVLTGTVVLSMMPLLLDKHTIQAEAVKIG